MGKAFVDRIENPTTFAIEQSSFFLYFAGDARSAGGSAMIDHLPSRRLLMPSAPGWLKIAQEIHGAKLIEDHRSSFSSEKLSIPHLQHLIDHSPVGDAVKRMDTTMVRHPTSPADLSDFESVEDFLARGIAYGVMQNDTVVGVAYSSLICSKGIEVSIFVSPEHRRQGIATVLASHLLKWSLEHNLDPHWDAANPESCKLAEKLGYLPTETYTAYYLQS
jgi:GNAT superfamily N-acetyltransferase